MIALLLLAASTPCLQPFVHDGDYLRCGGVKMRLAGIDAAEMPGSPRCRPPVSPRTDCDQRRALAARDALRKMVRGRAVAFRIVDASPFIPGFQSSDRFGRPVVRAQASGVDLSDALLAAGMVRRWP